jgi:DNA-binding beta-propeller fold protein YncE
VQRVDPGSNRVIETIPLGGTWGADVDVDETSVWAAYFGKEHAGVVRIDPATDSVVADVQLPSDHVRRITAAGGGVVATELEWSGNQGPCMVLTAIDRVGAEIIAREPVEPDCGNVELIEWNGAIWASGAGLQRVDPTTARIVDEPIPFDPEHFPRSFVVAVGNEVWFGAYPGGSGVRPDRLARLDPATGRIEYFIEVGGTDAVFAPETRTIWILEFDGTLTRVDLNGG